MSMNWRTLIVLLCVVLIIGGCSLDTDEKVFKKVHQKLTGLQSYNCMAEIYVKGNKKPEQFNVKQWFSVPDKYRLEIIDQGNMKDKITVFDGERIWMYYPYIDQIFLLENVDTTSEENLFVGFFLRDLLESEEIDYYTVEKDGEEMVVIELPVPGGNKYRYTQKLYVNKKHIIPVLLEIYDINGEVTTRVRYSDFSYNHDLNPDLFNQGTISKCMLYEELDISELFLSSLEEARQALDFSPLSLTAIPKGFEGDYIQVINSDKGNVLVMSYKGQNESFSILQGLLSMEEGEYSPSGEMLSIEGRNAVYSQDQHTRKIWWREGNIDIQVIGTVSRRTLMEIAKKIR